MTPIPTPRRLAAPLAVILALACLSPLGASAGQTPPTAAIAAPDGAGRPARYPTRRPGTDGTPVVERSSSSGWWLIAVVGIAGLAAAGYWRKRLATGSSRGHGEPAALRVVDRLALTPRHAIHLVRVGPKTLVLGTGVGGAPTLLGEWPTPGADEKAPGAVPSGGDS